MYFEQFYLGCLAHASYLLGSEGEGVVVDPQRDVEIYLEAAEKNGLKIRYIFETHLHADFVSGHQELAARTGAQIYLSRHAGATFPHVDVDDGYRLRVGELEIEVLATPGHTPESISLLVTDLSIGAKTPTPPKEGGVGHPRDLSTQVSAQQQGVNPSTSSGQALGHTGGHPPWAVLTGDTLFIGDVGRPDLSPTHTPVQLAGMLHDSLQRLMTLPDSVLVYPAHGAGSLCGRNMRAERFSTIGTERLTNYALQIRDRDEFVRQMTSNLPARPDYFLEDAAINRAGAPALSDLPELKAVSAQELKAMLDKGAMVLDVRPGAEFGAGHVPGSVSIPLSGQFASWAGAVLGLSSRPVLVAANADQVSEARTRLARIGIEDVAGYLGGGVEGWHDAGLAVAQTKQITAQELSSRLATGSIGVLDVRREAEFQAGHIEGADWHPLDRFKAALPDIGKDTAIAVHCKSGYRSLIAASLLERAGYHNVVDLAGGFDAWAGAGLPSSTEAVEVGAK
jgi:rhodanese-related sulfurtransferase/glyoxylase-like metal-dependent hydrolase (beta-lactamase superfamily II)